MDEVEAYLWLQTHHVLDNDEDQLAKAVLGLTATMAVHSQEERARRRAKKRAYLVRANLLPNPRFGTPWQQLYRSKSDRAYITTMGFDVATFHKILNAGFARQWYTMPIARSDVKSTGWTRPTARSLDAAGALGLVLHYLSSTMHEIALQEIFAVVPASLSRYITSGLKIFLTTLREMPDARIAWPKGDEFNQLNNAIRERHPRLMGAFASIDGLNLPMQTSGNQDIENATYNGWLHEHFVSSVLVFAPNGLCILSDGRRTTNTVFSGLIIGAHLNAPGSWHDSRVAQPIYRRLRDETPAEFYLVADSAFPRGGQAIQGRIKAPLKAGQRIEGTSMEIAEVMQFNRELLSYRQTAEWGNRGLQGSFGRLRVPLPVNAVKRRGDVLETCVRAFCLRTKCIGVNQINSVYVGEGNHEERQIWATFENILFSDQRRNDRVLRFHISASY